MRQMTELLRKYVKQIVREALTKADDKTKEIEQKEDEPEEELTEFSSAAGVAGYSLPLGMNPDDAGRKKNKTS